MDNAEVFDWLVIGTAHDLFMLDAMDIMRDQLAAMPRLAWENKVRNVEWLEDFRDRHLELLKPIHKATWLHDYRMPMELSDSIGQLDLEVSSWGSGARAPKA